MFILFFLFFYLFFFFFFFSSRRRHTRSKRDWSSDVCSSDLEQMNKLFFEIAVVLTFTSLHSQTWQWAKAPIPEGVSDRSEERRVGKECRSRWGKYHDKKKRRR